MAGKKAKHGDPWRASRRLIRVLLLLFVVVLAVVLALMLPAVQTKLAKELGSYLSRELGSELRVERVELRLFGPHRLHGLFIADHKGDTLIAVDELWLRGLKIHADTRTIELRRLELHRARFALARGADEPHTNLTVLLDKLSGTDDDDGPETAPWTVRCAQVDIRDLHFSHEDDHFAPLPYGVDVSHVDIPSARIIGGDFLMAGDSILFRFDQTALTERSGAVVEQMSGQARVAPRGIRVQDLHLVTGGQQEGALGSDVRGDIDFRTEDLDDLDDFIGRVFIQAKLDSSRVQFADVALFAPELKGVDYTVAVSGVLQGMVNDFKGRNVVLHFGEHSVFRGDVEMSGLPDFQNTFIVLDAEQLRTDPGDLAALPMPPFTSGRKLDLPDEVRRLGNITFAGNFTGFATAFTAFGHTQTEAGALRTDISYQRDTVSGIFNLTGLLATGGFDLGKVLGSSAVGRIAMDTRVSARGRDLASLSAEIDGVVPELGLEHYTISNINLNGKLEKNLFNGELHCNDPKVALDFNGLADLRGTWPEVDFTADIHRLDLRALGVLGGTGYSDIQMQANVKGQLAPDSLQGMIRLHDVTYCQDSLDLFLGDIALDAWHEAGSPRLKLESTMVDARVDGTFYPTLLGTAVQSVVFSIFPSLHAEVDYAQDPQHFVYDVRLKEAQPVLDLVMPGLRLGHGTHASGFFDTRTFDLDLDMEMPAFAYQGFASDSLRLVVGKTMDLLAFRLQGDGRFGQDSIRLNDLLVTGKAYQDEIDLSARWKGGKDEINGTVNLSALVKNLSSVDIHLEPSSVDIGRGLWSNERVAHIQVDSSTISIDTLQLHNQGQYIRLGGTISRDPSAALNFELLDVHTTNLEPFYSGPVVHGSISGDGRVFNVYDKPYLFSYLCVDGLAVENKPVGDLNFAASFSEGEELVHVNGNLQRGDLRAFDFSGTISPGREQELDLRLKMDRFDLRFLEPYLPDAISDIQGRVTGDITLKGRFDAPEINGYADLDKAGLRIGYLNTFYSFTDQVFIRPNMFALDQVKLIDEEGNTAIASGTILHRGLRDWNFDMYMEMNGLKVLDTDAHNNELYYGKAYATGMMGLSGHAGSLEVTVEAATAEGTDIHFPLGGSQEVGGIPFVQFASVDHEHDDMHEDIDLTGIDLDLKVAVTPDARFELIFDPTVGDIMRARGNGNISMSVTQTGEFSMKGDVEIVDGDYLFTLRNLVNKRFGVEPGGHITWYGDPFDAIINVDAVYRLRASLFDVMPPGLRTEAYKKRFPVEVLMHLSQNLMNPDIGFDVKLPSVDDAVRTQVKSAMGTQDDLNKQVFALIVLNRFLPSDAGAAPEGSGLGGATSATGTELLSNQLSNWLSSFSRNLDLGVNWRTGDVISQDEVELAVSTAIFNERLLLNTNVGVAYGQGGTTEGANSLIGDFSIEYILTQDGKLRFKAFSQSNDRNLNQVDQAQTTQGAGLAYREEFDTLKEFFQKVGRLFGKRKNEAERR